MIRNRIEFIKAPNYGPQGWEKTWRKPRTLSRVEPVLREARERALQDPERTLQSQTLVGSRQEPKERVVVDLTAILNVPTLPKVTW